MNLQPLQTKDAERRFRADTGEVYLVGIDLARREITIRTLGQRHVSRISIADEVRRHAQVMFEAPAPKPCICPKCQEIACECAIPSGPSPAPAPALANVPAASPWSRVLAKVGKCIRRGEA